MVIFQNISIFTDDENTTLNKILNFKVYLKPCNCLKMYLKLTTYMTMLYIIAIVHLKKMHFNLILIITPTKMLASNLRMNMIKTHPYHVLIT